MGTQSQSEPARRAELDLDVGISERAEEVRNVLKGASPMPLAGIARRITDATTNEVAMAVGWLAHAGEIQFRKHGNLLEINLK